MTPERSSQFDRASQETWDLAVIGGGASGLGVALEAASRGLKVALFERHDLTEGTSSRSTKLLHGGVRYLELAVRKLDRAQLALVREALEERGLLLRLAPHLAQPIWLLTPLRQAWEVPYYWIGLKMYDLLAGQQRLSLSRYLSSQTTHRLFPSLQGPLLGSVAYQDGQFDDARFGVSLALTAQEHGALILTQAEVVGLLKTEGHLRGIAVKDRLSEQIIEVSAKVVVNATGPFTDTIRQLDDPNAEPLLKTSSGVHLVLNKEYAPPSAGLLIPHTEDGRVLFVLPWHQRILIGTTDESAPPAEHPPVHPEEVSYLLRQVEPYLGRIPVEAVASSWSGFRPLVGRAPKSTAQLVREHLVDESPSGLLTLTGGKWTTYRKMAYDLVEYARTHFQLAAGPSRSREILLAGGEHFDPHGAQHLQERFGLSVELASHLHRAYGSRAERVAQLIQQGYAAPLAPGYPYVEAEVIHAVRDELALKPMDVLAPRTRLAFLDLEAARQALPRVNQLMAQELGWDAGRAQRYLQEAEQQLQQAL